MAFNWDTMFRRYVYDDEKTPYFTSVGRLNKRQARNEIFAYGFLVTMLFGLLGFVALSGKLPHGNAVGVPIYAFMTAWMAGVFVWTKNQMAAAVCAIAPIAVVVYLAMYGFPPKLGENDKILIGLGLAAWAYYSWRIVRIAARYPDMAEPAEPEKPFRRNPFDMLK